MRADNAVNAIAPTYGHDGASAICMLVRQEKGMEIRQLAPLFAVLVNGEPAAGTALKDGDRITLGSTEIQVQIRSMPPVAA